MTCMPCTLARKFKPEEIIMPVGLTQVRTHSLVGMRTKVTIASISIFSEHGRK